jgi:hypothetical protein
MLTISKTVAVVVLLAADFWNCRVSKRMLLVAAMVSIGPLLLTECFRENVGRVTFLESGRYRPHDRL